MCAVSDIYVMGCWKGKPVGASSAYVFQRCDNLRSNYVHSLYSSASSESRDPFRRYTDLCGSHYVPVGDRPSPCVSSSTNLPGLADTVTDTASVAQSASHGFSSSQPPLVCRRSGSHGSTSPGTYVDILDCNYGCNNHDFSHCEYTKCNHYLVCLDFDLLSFPNTVCIGTRSEARAPTLVMNKERSPRYATRFA